MLAVWQSTITDDAGNVRPGASVRVTDSDTDALVTLKPNRDGTGSLANPFAADSEGFAKFYVAQGRYDIRVTFAGDQRDHVDVVLFADAQVSLFPGNTRIVVPAAGTTEDLAVSGFDDDTTVILFQTGAGAASIGGLPLGTDGQVVLLVADDANGVTFLAESAGSTAARRIYAAFDLTLPHKATAQVRYNSSLSRWILIP